MDPHAKDAGGQNLVAATTQMDAEVFFRQLAYELQKHLQPQHAMRRRDGLTEQQKAADKAFRAIGAGLAVRDFPSVLRAIARDERGVLRVVFPKHAVKARVYSKKGVSEYDAGKCGNALELRDSTDPVARIEFFDTKGEVVEATAAEAPQTSPGSEGSR